MSQHKRKNCKRNKAAAAATQGALGAAVHPHAAGIDVGATELVAATKYATCSCLTTSTFCDSGGVAVIRSNILLALEIR